MIERIERAAGVPGLLDALVDRLSPADLRSLLLEVHRRRAAKTTPARVLSQYRENRFTGVSTVDPRVLVEFDRRAFAVLGSLGYEPVELSPVSPRGSPRTSGCSAWSPSAATRARSSSRRAACTTSSPRCCGYSTPPAGDSRHRGWS